MAYYNYAGELIKDAEDVSQIKTFNLWDKYLVEPFRNWLDIKVTGLKMSIINWIRINGIDIIQLVAIVIVSSILLKILFIGKKEKDGMILYTTFVAYILLKLIWRVVLHA